MRTPNWGSDGVSQYTFRGLIITQTNALPINTDPITIDCSLQPGFLNAPIIDPIEALMAGDGRGFDSDLRLHYSLSTLELLVHYSLDGSGVCIQSGGELVAT